MAKAPTSVAFSTSHAARSGRKRGHQQLDPDGRLVGRRRLAEGEHPGGAVHASDGGPTSPAGAVHDSQSIPNGEPRRAEEVAVGVALDGELVAVEAGGVGEEGGRHSAGVAL